MIMRIISLLFIILGLMSFIIGALNRYDVLKVANDPITFIEITQTSLMFAIAFGVLSLRKE